MSPSTVLAILGFGGFVLAAARRPADPRSADTSMRDRAIAAQRVAADAARVARELAEQASKVP